MHRLVLYPVMAGVDANPFAIFAACADDWRLRHASDTNGRLGRARRDGLKRDNASDKNKDRRGGNMTNTHAEKRTTMTTETR